MFKITKKSTKSKARLGIVTTAHGKIQTPFFMPDATRAAVKGLSGDDLRALGLEAMVINTYHLLLQPGLDIIKKAGGAHKFMNWAGPLCSDSGGYQVYSLIHKNRGFRHPDANLRHPELVSGSRPAESAGGMTIGKITDDKVIFRSPLDGSLHELTPEKSIQIQFDLGADMIVCLDDCPPHDLARPAMEKSVERTIAWARRCRAEYERLVPVPILPKPMLNRPVGTGTLLPKGRATSAPLRQGYGRQAAGRPLLFAVIQGGADLALRKKCARALLAIGFDGFGWGARPVDKEGKFLSKVASAVAAMIPDYSPPFQEPVPYPVSSTGQALIREGEGGGFVRFALGVGTPSDIIKSVKAGWDMFDCVIPTREARHGRIYYWKIDRSNQSSILHLLSSRRQWHGASNITNSRFARDFAPINAHSKLPELRDNSRAYLHHLFKIGEPQAGRLATLNNLEFYLDLMKAIRVAIRRGLL